MAKAVGALSKMSSLHAVGDRKRCKNQARKQFPARPPILRRSVVENISEDNTKLGGGQKRKAWLPPGPGGGNGSTRP